MSEHEQVMNIIRGKDQVPIELDPGRTALLVVDMQRYFTQGSFPFTEVFEKLSPGSSSGYLKRVRETVIPSIQRLLSCFRAHGSPIAYAVGTDAGDGRDLPCWLRSFDELGLATIGKRVWPPVSDPSWEIEELLSAGPGGSDTQQAFRRYLCNYRSRATAPPSGCRVGRGNRSVERRLRGDHRARSGGSRLPDDHRQRCLHNIQRANAPGKPRHLQHRFWLGPNGR